MQPALPAADHPSTKPSWPRIALTGLIAWWTFRSAASADPWCFLDYANLASVHSGDMVEPVYFELVDAATTPERKAALTAALLTYCERDTLGMVRLAEFLGRRANDG